MTYLKSVLDLLFTQGCLQLLFIFFTRLEKSLNEHIICYNFSFSILLLNLVEELTSILNISLVLDIIFSLIHPFTFFDIKVMESIHFYT